MTVNDVYLISLSLMAEQQADATDYEPQVAPLVNLMLPELFAINNSIRISKCMKPLTEIPTVSQLTDELTYEDELVRGTLPYGLAAKLTLDDDMAKASYFNSEYVEKQAWFKRSIPRPICDFY